MTQNNYARVLAHAYVDMLRDINSQRIFDGCNKGRVLLQLSFYYKNRNSKRYSCKK